MRIGLIGAGGTGKTTLAKAFSELTGYPFHPSMSRGVFKDFGLKETDQLSRTPEENWQIQQEIFRRKIKQDKQNPVGIFDRTPLDQICYSFFWSSAAIDDNIATQMMDRVYTSLHHEYRLIVFCPIYDWNYEKDGMRYDSMAYRQVYQAALLGFMHRWHVRFYTCPNSSVDTRACWLKSLIQMTTSDQATNFRCRPLKDLV